MKKYLLPILLGAFGAVVLAAPALAATSVSFTPVIVSVRQGQTFILTIGVNPQGVKNYTAKTELHYPAGLLEVKSFIFANSWIPLSQPGYDLTDNTNGVLIKTAGYPGGVSSAVTFGTVSFLAKKSGNGTIALNGNSFALDANNQNVLAGASVQTAVAISAPAPTPTAPETPVTEPKEEKPAVQGIEQEAPTAQGQPAVLQPIASRSLLAQVGGFITLGTDSVIVGILVTIVILTLIGYAIYAVSQRSRRKNFGSRR